MCAGCELGQFRCGTGRCIPGDWHCDGTSDCVDDSDEQDCPQVTCDHSHFQCLSDGECIPDVWVCDDEEDCEDGSDERQNCPGRTCTGDQFTCSNGMCIPALYRCDHMADCSDGSDERHCNYPECTQLRCTNGACYDRTQRCDHVLDCRDGSDEANCTQHCNAGMFQCQNGLCIPQRYVCDHDDDCGDRSDELNCTYPTCKGNYFTCPSGRCIHQVWLCDGEDDCEDNADEKGCGKDGEYKCTSIFIDGLISSLVYFDDCSMWGECDQVCEDRIGSHRCSCLQGYVLEQHRYCRADIQTGVPSLIFSNGKDLIMGDIHGNSQHALISSQNRGIAVGVDFHYNLRLIFWTDTIQNKVFSAHMDGSNMQVVLDVSVDYPENLAVDWVNNKLYVVEASVNRIDMVDFDGSNRVTLITENLGNPRGLAVDPTVGKTVVHGGAVIPHPFSISLFEHHVYFTDWTKMAVMKANKFTDSSPEVIYRTPQTPHGVAVIHQLRQPQVANPCAADRGGCEQICILSHRSDNGGLGYRCKCRIGYDLHADGKREVLAANRVEGVEDLAYDWISKNLYWTDPRYRSISVMRLADKSRRAIIRNLNNPRAIVVHPIMGYIFWTDWYRPAKIMRAWGDGSHAVSIVNTTLGWPNGLAIDWSAMRLYWVDAFFDKIEHSNFDGRNRLSLERIAQISHPFGLTIFEGYAYFTDWRLGGIVRVRKSDGGEMVIIRRGISHIMHVKSFNSNSQIGSNFCNRPTYPNGDCSHFCFPAPGSQRVCGCPYGMKLSLNQQTCVDDPSNEPPTLQCGANSFSCGNGKCVPNSYRCDGVDDCHDNSDEMSCGVNSTTCSPSAFTCANRRCVPVGWRCDGHNDCLDDSDEINCPTRVPGTCPANQFTCANHRCIPHTWRCDTDNDCGDGSDEVDCRNTCNPEQFQCPDHRCIDPNYICDGDRDCVDGADEQDCSYNCTANEFKCTNGHQCISSYYHCDGVFDCSDRSDEHNCPTRPPGMCHHESEFQCQSDGSCVPSTWECDGHPDCEDGSDEHHACPPRTCSSSLFRCDNGNCVLRSWICDGDNDCRDMSDERDCPTPPFRCPSWQWQCPGYSLCINITTVCDNTPNCPNGADESPLCSKFSHSSL
uniref:Low density lipoprotein receptor-related protein 2a n=1 Tax=Oryzias latipes TaxID=8090 RepID=A0A3B3I417_ORYLA